jgi:two-component system cell cycle sensor histidine kinase/response regulator CckA
VNEVSCRALGVVFDGLTSRGISHDKLVEGLSTSLPLLRDPNARIAWELFTRLCDRAAFLAGGPSALEEMGYRQNRTKSYAFVRRVASAFTRPRDVYWLGTVWFGRHLFTIVEDEFEELPDGRIRECLRIPQPYRQCEAFFHIIKGALRAAPSLVGHDDASIESEITPREATYWISVPPDRSLRRLWRMIAAPFRFPALIEELSHQQQELRRSYGDLANALEALRESEERHRILSELASDYSYAALVDSDGESSLQWVTGAFHRITGYSVSELEQGAWRRLIHPADRSLVQTTTRRALDKGFARNEHRIVARSGEVRWVLELLRVKRDESGRTWLYGAVQDITERKSAEQALQRLATAMDQAGDGIGLFGPDGTVVYANRSFSAMMDTDHRHVVGRSIESLLVDPGDLSMLTAVQESVLSGEVWRGRFRGPRQDGSQRVRDATVSPVRDEAGAVQGYVGVLRDVTREVRLEEDLLHAQRIEGLGRLAGGLAHDFNNLLTVISGYGEILLSHIGEDPTATEALSQIRESADRGSQLVRRLLAFSRRQALKPQILDANAMIEDLAKMLRRTIGEHVELDVRLDPQLAPVQADRAELEQLLLNLALNARDAMPRGGYLTFETHNVDIQNARARELGLEAGSFVAISISDTGLGMDEATRARVFEPFFTTKEVGRGVGLGLSMAFGVAKQSGGTIDVVSAPGRGSIFTLYLPRVDSAPGASPALPDPLPTSQQRRATVLLVEDDETVRNLARAALEERGFEVLDAADGEVALALARSQEKEIHLLLSDLVMPRMSGVELYERLSSIQPGLRVLYVSGYPGLEQEGWEPPPGTALLTKPFTPSELVAEVWEALGPEFQPRVYSDDSSDSPRGPRR